MSTKRPFTLLHNTLVPLLNCIYNKDYLIMLAFLSNVEKGRNLVWRQEN